MTARTLVVDALLTGRSLAALTAALELAEVGLRVAIPPASTEAEQLECDTAGERDPEHHITALLERIAAPIGTGTAAEVDAPVDGRCLPEFHDPASPWLRAADGSWRPQATPTIMGMPAEPLDPATVGLLGSGGSVRAYLDRVFPVLTIGKTQYLGKLVRRRLGRRALDTLTCPLVRERFGAHPDEVEVAIAAPGLNEALTRGGALTVAVLSGSEKHRERERLIRPAGGWSALREAMLQRLEHFGAVVLDEPVSNLSEREDEWCADLVETETTVIARSLILDRPRDPASGEAWRSVQRDSAAEMPGSRVYAEIYIETPAEVEPGGEAASRLEIIGDWTVRVEPGDASASEDEPSSTWRVRCAGPRQDSDELQTSAPIENGTTAPVAELTELLERAGLSPRADAHWNIERRAAPYIAIAERTRARDALGSWAEHDLTALPVGRAWHADDLGRAIEFAHESGIALRRRLLGLTEGE